MDGDDVPPTLQVDGTLIIASQGHMWLRMEALDPYADLGVGQQVNLSHGGELLQGVVRSISPNGDIHVRLHP